jgi:putative ABC transport system permease protein
MKFAILVIRNLTRNKRRTILTVLSIAVSLFIFSALVSIPTLVGEILADSASSLRIAVHNKAGLAYDMPMAYAQRIATVPHVAAVTPESWYGGLYHEVSDQFPNEAVDPDQAEKVWPDWGVTSEQWQQFRSLRTACLVGAATMKRFNFHTGQQIMLRGTVYDFPVTLTIVGVLRGKAPPDFLIFRRDYLEQAAGHSPFVDIFWVRADDSRNVEQVIAALDQEFSNSSAETHSESEAAFDSNFITGYRTLFRLFEVLGAIILITIALVAANTAAMSIRERRSEIAVMRSIGFTSRTILSLLICESLTISLLGGLLGCGAGFLVLRAFPSVMPSLGGLPMQMPSLVLVDALAISALIGIVSAAVPAHSAARRNIVDALRAGG